MHFSRTVIFILLFFISITSFAVTETWDGGGGDDNWSTGANWADDSAPTGGEDLVFAGSTRTTPNNDIAAATSFASITFSVGASDFTLSGNSVTLTGGGTAITGNHTSGTMTIALDIIFGTSAPFISTTSGGTLTISGAVANGGLKVTIDGTGAAIISGVISGTGGVYIDTAIDNLTIFSGVNTFTGDCDVETGGLRITNASGCGAGTKTNDIANGTAGEDNLRLDGSGGDITLPSTLSFLLSTNAGSWGGIINESGNNTINGDVTLGTGGGGTRFRVDGGTLTLTGTYTPNSATRYMRLDGSGNGVFSGSLVDGGFAPELRKWGTGTWTLTNSHTFTGDIEAQEGTLVLGASEIINDGVRLMMSSGTFSTGATTGYSETLGTLYMESNGTIALGSGVHTLNFADSDGESWTAAKLLQITGWQGGYNGTSGTEGRIYTGSSAELSSAKLDQIFFTHPISSLPYTATQLADGEIVPTSTLPVELYSFTGSFSGDKVQLEWITASEINSDYFDIQRSRDGENFESIGRVDAAGNSYGFLFYSFNDVSCDGVQYYKLVERDFDGSQQESPVVVIQGKEKSNPLNVYPNPNSGNVSVSFFSMEEGMHFLKIYNLNGEEVYQAIVATIKGENKFQFSTMDLSNGQYIVELTSLNYKKVSAKMVKSN